MYNYKEVETHTSVSFTSKEINYEDAKTVVDNIIAKYSNKPLTEEVGKIIKEELEKASYEVTYHQ